MIALTSITCLAERVLTMHVFVSVVCH